MFQVTHNRKSLFKVLESTETKSQRWGYGGLQMPEGVSHWKENLESLVK